MSSLNTSPNRKRSIRPSSTIVDAQESKQLRCFDCRVQPVYIYSPFGGRPVRDVDDNEPTIWQVINIQAKLAPDPKTMLVFQR
jgi:hypothetical protein